jgi:2-amino-4-hydroxy-6-hydroxymethyldihydropteridine diphosphokinase
MLAAMQVVIALGSNLGDRTSYLREARAAIASGPRVLAASRVFETPPVGPPQPDYLNAALLVETSLTPDEVLETCLAIERKLGRMRQERWGPRTIDLDLLWADDGDGIPRIVDTSTLQLPHPHLSERSFALAPLLDVRPDLGSRYGKTLNALGGPPPAVHVEGWTSFDRAK